MAGHCTYEQNSFKGHMENAQIGKETVSINRSITGKGLKKNFKNFKK